METALLEAPLAQHVDARTTRLGCATTKKKTQKKNKKKQKRTGSHRQTDLPNKKNSQYVHKNLQNSIYVQDQVADKFEKMSFYSMEDRGKKCSRTEAFASLEIILPNRKGVHELKIKVDTGVEGNTLPLRTFQQMFPEHVDRNG